MLPENGEMIMTIAEKEILNDIIPFYKKYFIVKYDNIFGKSQHDNHSHRNMVVLIKKPDVLVK